MTSDRPRPDLPTRILNLLGSLRLTVTLLALAIFLVFVGTLAQVHAGIWTVIDQYFRCWFAWVDFKVFGNKGNDLGGGFYFPGGKLLGAALLVNLVVSHTRRIRVEARGGKLAIGTAILAIGSALTWLAIATVFDADSSEKKIDPTWRVTLQLLQGGGAAAVLFMGCWMVFRRKAGIVLLHSGIVLMMVTELVATYHAKEGTMSVYEGQTVGFVEDNRSVELAILDGSDPKTDDVTTVSEGLLRRGLPIALPDLPFDIEVSPDGFLKNCALKESDGKHSNPATAGLGVRWIARPRSEEPGASSSGKVDLSAVYVTFRDRSTKASLGTWLFAVELTLQQFEQKVQAGGKEYRVALRFPRTYKPYSLYLYDFRFERYPGTTKPKDFSSFVRLMDPERHVARDVRIWMNNPLRYRGDTLYQSSYDGETETGTILQVVENRGWMVPYVACMIVAAGLLGQFLLSLSGFLRRRREEVRP